MGLDRFLDDYLKVQSRARLTCRKTNLEHPTGYASECTSMVHKFLESLKMEWWTNITNQGVRTGLQLLSRVTNEL